MISLSNIPEPSGACGPEPPPEASHEVLIPGGVAPDSRAPASVEFQEPGEEEPQSQIDNLAILIILLIAGGLLRIVLGVLGPMQGIGAERLLQSQERGQSVLSGDPQNSYPLFDLIVTGLTNISAPAWIAILLGSLLTLGAIPAAYLIGLATTGRRVPGIVAAAIIAVHPAVLTASNQLSPAALAMALLLIGLALVCCVTKRGLGYALVGGLMLGLAGLTAPLCWLVGVFACPLTIKLARRRGTGKAVAYGCCVCVLSLGPALGYRALFNGQTTEALLHEFAQADHANKRLPASDQLLVTMTQPSFAELGEALHLPLSEAGRLRVTNATSATANERRDIVADILADGWLLLNAAIASLAAISAGVMLLRRRLIELALLAGPLIALAFTVLPPSEMLRLPLIGLVSVLALGLLATRPAPMISEEQRDARRLAKYAKQEEKERAKQQRELDKHKDDLLTFEKPTRAEVRRAKLEKAKQKDLGLPADSTQVLSKYEEEPAISARPI